jgi:hypothetical protein
MKKTILKNLILVITILLSANTFAQRDNGFYLKYELNGKEYVYDNGDVLTYTKHDTASKEKVQHTKYSIFVTSTAEAEYKMSFLFYTKALSKLEATKLKIGSILAYKKGLPSVHVKVDIKTGEKYTFYGTKEGGLGNVEIIKVDGDWVEGIFELNIPESYGTTNSPLKVTKGSFKFKMKAK